MKTTLTRALLFVSISATLVACGGGSAPQDRAAKATTPDEISLAVGGTPNELQVWEKIAVEFEQQTSTHVNLIRQPTGTDQRRQGLIIPLKAGESDPDVFLMDVAWISQFAASGWLDTLDADGGVKTEAFFAKVVDLADRFDGKLIALPVYVDAGMLYYRRDLLEANGIKEPPATWEDMIRIAKMIQAKERVRNPKFFGFVWQGAQYEGLICNFLEFAGSHNGGLLLENGRVSLATPQNAAALTMMRGFLEGEAISPPNTYTEMKEEEVRSVFQGGDALFERNWPYAYALHESPESPVRDKTGIASLPHAPSGPSVSTLGGWHVGVSKFSNSKAQARKFVAFLTSFETQKRLVMDLGWNPGRTDVYADTEVLAKYPHFAALKAVFEHAVPRPNLPYYTQISDAIQKPINAVLAGKMDPMAGLKQAEAEAQKAVDMYQ